MSSSGIARLCKDIYANIVSLFPLRPLADPKYFSLFEKKGVHVTPDFHYSPIPRLSELDDNIWKNESQLVGVDMNEQKQLELLKIFKERFAKEYDQFLKTAGDTKNPGEYYLQNTFYGSVDAEILYSMVRYFKPRKIVEIGSGFTTYLSLQAIRENQKEGSPQTELVAIECAPNETLKNGLPGLTLLSKRIEEVDLSRLTDLQENDILFIDSSHTVRIGGDVSYLFLEVLPRLRKGVLVHVHDIFFPNEYPKEWIKDHNYFWAEQYVLQAFLAFNRAFEVLWCGSFMHRRHSSELAAAISSYRPQGEVKDLPKSFWMRKTE